MPQYALHLSNVLLLASYWVKDILWLRVLTIVAGAVMLIGELAMLHPLWESVCWQLLFDVINVYRIIVLLHERRPVRFTDEEQRVYQRAFRTLTPREYKKLLALAKWEDATVDAHLVVRDQPLLRMMVIVSGRTSVHAGGKSVVELGEGQFVGEMSFLTGLNPTADVFAVADTRLLSWPKQELKAFLQDNPDLRAAMQMVIGTDLVGKLRVHAA